ncbi:LytR family transcriptional regulator [Agromyces intestinalis]|uniref:LytR family transcriptional regulator n=1 Tax=Agromyces intestinalis TaxID=2592652 RepID=A0A5C1YHD7_9MICO|nr:LCP family protein [Agromyces intestinalis]QEO14172.1 LytR family transcriptional regulator [Agromyces intestinalis]
MQNLVRRANPMRHGRLQRRRVLTSGPVKAVALALCSMLASTAIVGAFFVTSTFATVSDNAVDIGTSEELPDIGLGGVEGGFDVLVVGADNDANQGDAFGERDGTLNDVNIWLHVNQDHARAVAVSFPRDLIIPHPECADPNTGETFDAMSAQPLNSAFSRGGLACVAQTISSLTGEQFEYAASVSFNGVIALSDAVGGVQVCLADPIFDPDADLDLPAGLVTLQGASALGFLRTRHGIGDGSDLARISNQQSFLSALMRRVKSEATLSDPGKVVGIARVAADHMVLSTSLANPITMASLAIALKDVPLDQIVFVQYPGTTGSAEFPGKVVPLEDQAAQLVSAVIADQPFQLGADALGQGVTVDPAAPAEPAPADPPPVDEGAAEPAPDESAQETPDDPAAQAAPPVDPAPPAAPPPVIEGLKGQDASQATCTVGFVD